MDSYDSYDSYDSNEDLESFGLANLDELTALASGVESKRPKTPEGSRSPSPHEFMSKPGADVAVSSTTVVMPGPTDPGMGGRNARATAASVPEPTSVATAPGGPPGREIRMDEIIGGLLQDIRFIETVIDDYVAPGIQTYLRSAEFIENSNEEFDKVDVDGSGSLSAEELYPLVESLVQTTSGGSSPDRSSDRPTLQRQESWSVSKEEWMQGFTLLFDTERNGMLSRDEFAQFAKVVMVLSYLGNLTDAAPNSFEDAEDVDDTLNHLLADLVVAEEKDRLGIAGTGVRSEQTFIPSGFSEPTQPPRAETGGATPSDQEQADILEALNYLADMRNAGQLTEDEYAVAKAKLMEGGSGAEDASEGTEGGGWDGGEDGTNGGWENREDDQEAFADEYGDDDDDDDDEEGFDDGDGFYEDEDDEEGDWDDEEDARQPVAQEDSENISAGPSLRRRGMITPLNLQDTGDDTPQNASMKKLLKRGGMKIGGRERIDLMSMRMHEISRRDFHEIEIT